MTNETIAGLLEQLSTPGWWQLLLCFLSCSMLMITRLNAIEKNGFEGTIIGTLIMPYFSGFPNLCFVYLMLQKGQNGSIIIENCLVNNITNLTLVIGIPSLIWGLHLYKRGEQRRIEHRIDHLSLLLSLLALIFFCLCVFFLAKDGTLSFSDGAILTGVFFFWQLYHIFDVLKNNIKNERRIKKRIIVDLIVISLCAWGVFSSTDQLVGWVESNGKGFFTPANLGVLSGLLMVIPNAFLAFFYAMIHRHEIAYSSQIGDCHICIPLCIGLFALFSPITVSTGLLPGFYLLMTACGVHLFFTAIMGRLPRLAGLFFIGMYAFYLFRIVIK